MPRKTGQGEEILLVFAVVDLAEPCLVDEHQNYQRERRKQLHVSSPLSVAPHCAVAEYE